MCGRISTFSRCANSDGLAIGPHVECKNDRAGRRGQEHVGFGDRADAGMEDFELHVIGRKLGQQFAQHLHRPLHVGLDDDRQFFGFAGLKLLVQLVESDAGAGAARERRLAQLALPVIYDVPRLGFIGYLEVIAGLRHTLQAEHLDRSRGPCLLYRAAVIVEQGANFAVNSAANENVAGMQGAVLHQHGGHRPAPPVDA